MTDPRLPLERDIERTIKEGVEGRGGYFWHVRDSRRKDVTDMPDMVIVLPPYVALLETKSQRRIVTPGQAHVLSLLADCQALLTGVVRPNPKPGEMSLDDVLDALGITGVERRTA